jgi:hypothetical protein
MSFGIPHTAASRTSHKMGSRSIYNFTKSSPPSCGGRLNNSVASLHCSAVSESVVGLNLSVVCPRSCFTPLSVYSSYINPIALIADSTFGSFGKPGWTLVLRTKRTRLIIELQNNPPRDLVAPVDLSTNSPLSQHWRIGDHKYVRRPSFGTQTVPSYELGLSVGYSMDVSTTMGNHLVGRAL